MKVPLMERRTKNLEINNFTVVELWNKERFTKLLLTITLKEQEQMRSCQKPLKGFGMIYEDS